jgi:CRP-like cAMP-binding protein
VNQSKSQYKNRILAALPKAELNRLAPHLSPVTFELRQELLDGKSSSYAYFVEDGLASVVVTVENGKTVEIGVVGKEGVVGIPNLLGAGSAPGSTFIQMAGSGFRIRAARLKEEFERAGPLRHILQKYLQAFLIQTAQTGVCNRLHNVQERLCRWLLACHDRAEGDRLPLTQEFLGDMLGAPRTTVTLAAGILQESGLIAYSRGNVTIKNRKKLENVACECYGTVADEYKRLALL